ncbi:Ribose 5-phosphate isomerase A (phosphoriboisomerase A) [Musa troglodytarum]|uniref:ribose-5-phosphate isomerase n=1 Tax=Musa troglodytarum TaxID=320322 RepID=A0A9E7H4A3_9LILI|nr:Ribose 5-phosphate isomerase A (phosphoriboisomerase A) [Musa troglodytarum]URE27269.1 Ribose 5-phosphate isomerase A (phosphoriboisomerase A) [Musa troglodytarum]
MEGKGIRKDNTIATATQMARAITSASLSASPPGAPHLPLRRPWTTRSVAASLHLSPIGLARSPRLPARATAPVACAPDLLQAAKVTVDEYVRSGMVVGLGSGRASGLAIKYLGQRLREGTLKGIVGVPTSVSSASEAAKAGIRLNNYQENLQIDFAFDDADLIEERTLTAVIGRRKFEGGESIIEEKSIVKKASGLAFIVAENQYTSDLDGSIPVLINSGNWLETAEEIDDLFLGDAEVWRRPSSGDAGPLGGDFPLVTREGHHVLDVIFTSPILDLGQVAKSLDQIDGVVDHGIICGIPCTVIIASNDGVEVIDNLSKDQVIDSL